jgi:hypothetical protein
LIAFKDVLIAVVIGVVVSISCMLIIPYAHRAGNLDKVVKTLIIASVVSVTAASFFFPYDYLHQKRVMMQV